MGRTGVWDDVQEAEDGVWTCLVQPSGWHIGHSVEAIETPFLLRYIQHCRMILLGYFDGSRVAPWQGLRGDDGVILMAAQEISIVRPVPTHQLLLVRSWVQRIGRSSATLGHTICDASTSEVLAHVVVHVVRTVAHRPSPISSINRPAVHHRSSHDNGVLCQPLTQQRAPDTAFTHPIRIRASDLDFNNHVTNCKYVEWMEDARVQAALQKGYTVQGDTDMNLVARKRTVRVNVAYKKEVVLGDQVAMRTWALCDRRSFGFHLVRGGVDVVCSGRIEVDQCDDARHHSSVWQSAL